MRKEYDFSEGKRASAIPHLAKLQAESAKGKVRITTYLDSDLVEEVIRQVIREELKKAA